MACACFSVSAPVAAPIGLPRTSLLSDRFIELSSSPPLYMRILPDPEIKQRLYLTTIKTCGYAKETSTQAIARQLFVGIKDLRSDKLEEVTIAERPARLAVVHGNLDNTPLSVAAYTMRGTDCVLDYVLWIKSPSEDSRVSALFDREILEFTDVIEETFSLLYD